MAPFSSEPHGFAPISRLLASRRGRRGLTVERQRVVPIQFDGLYFDEGFRADIIVEAAVIIELKSVEHLARSARDQGWHQESRQWLVKRQEKLSDSRLGVFA
jgi:hypothetical protein